MIGGRPRASAESRGENLRKRLERARRILTGEEGDRGLQAWFRDEIAARTGWTPGKASVHRWVRDGAEPRDSRVLGVLASLESEAAEKLRADLDLLT